MADIMGLRDTYKRDPCMRAFMDFVYGRKYNSSETIVDRIESKLRQQGDFSRSDIVQTFKNLERLEFGEFIIGRRGQPSRFRWKVHMIDAGRAAKGEEASVQPIREDEILSSESVAEEMSANSIRHTYNLRPNYIVQMELPSDLSAKEATRFAEFIKTLPFDGDDVG